MAREPAQMAGQLAFRGSAPQLKLPHFSFFPLHSSSAQTFGLQLFYVWQAFIAVCRGKAGSSMGWGVGVGILNALAVHGSMGPSVSGVTQQRGQKSASGSH